MTAKIESHFWIAINKLLAKNGYMELKAQREQECREGFDDHLQGTRFKLWAQHLRTVYLGLR